MSKPPLLRTSATSSGSIAGSRRAASSADAHFVLSREMSVRSAERASASRPLGRGPSAPRSPSGACGEGGGPTGPSPPLIERAPEVDF